MNASLKPMTAKPKANASSSNAPTKSPSIQSLATLSEVAKSLPDTSKYLVAIGCLIVVGIVLYSSFSNPDALTKSFVYYFVGAVLPILIALYVASPLASESISLYSAMYYFGAVLVLIIMGYIFYTIMNPSTVGFATDTVVFIKVFMLIIGLAIFFRVFERYLTTVRGWGGFFVQLIFFLPCLISDGIEALFDSMRVSSPMVIILFVIEVLLILAYFYLPKWVENPDKVSLLTDRTFLNRSTIVSKEGMFYMDRNATNKQNPAQFDDKESYRQNYALDAWFHVNSMTPANVAYNKSTTILRYGSVGKFTGKPSLLYRNGKLVVHLYEDGEGTELKDVDLLYQRWNHVAFSYEGTQVTMFLNGEVVFSQAIPLSKLVFSAADVIEVGQGDGTHEDAGLYGAIVDVNYYKSALTGPQVAAIYNLYGPHRPIVPDNKFV